MTVNLHLLFTVQGISMNYFGNFLSKHMFCMLKETSQLDVSFKHPEHIF